MATQNATTLKGYFNAGDEPTESNFADLVDSFPLLHTDHANFFTGSNHFGGLTSVTGSLRVNGGFNSVPKTLTPAASVNLLKKLLKECANV